MPTLPSALALETIDDGSSIIASEHRNNYAAIQTALNALLGMLDDGAAGNDILTAVGSTLAFKGAYTTFTPAWTSSGVAPAIGNGTLSGRYLQLGKFVHFEMYFLAGTTTTFGTGDYSFSLPVTAQFDNFWPIGWALGRDASSGFVFFPLPYLPTATTLGLQYLTSFVGAASSVVGAAAPWAWANADFIRITGVYEAA